MADALIPLAVTCLMLGLLYIGLHRLIEWVLPRPKAEPTTNCQCGRYHLGTRNVVSYTDSDARHTPEVCVRTLP